jgi:hypothetical protein
LAMNQNFNFVYKDSSLVNGSQLIQTVLACSRSAKISTLSLSCG